MFLSATPSRFYHWIITLFTDCLLILVIVCLGLQRGQANALARMAGKDQDSVNQGNCNRNTLFLNLTREYPQRKLPFQRYSTANLLFLCILGPVHTGTISYCSTSVRSKKWYGEGLRSHGYGKKSSGPFQNRSRNWGVRKSGPESGTIRYRTVPFSCEQKWYDIVPLSGPVLYLWVTSSWFL